MEERLAVLETKLALNERHAAERHQQVLTTLGEIKAKLTEHDGRFLRIGLALAGVGSLAGSVLGPVVKAILGVP